MKPIDVLEATPDAIRSVEFVRQYGNQIQTLLGVPTPNTYVPGSRLPIVANLLQPISSGEEGLAVILGLTDVTNSFRLESLGYFNTLNDFSFKLKVSQYDYDSNGIVVGNPTVLVTSDLLESRTATPEAVQAALTSSGVLGNKDVEVEVGNKIQSESLVINQSLIRQTPDFHYNTPAEDLYSYCGLWYIRFPNHQDKALALEPLNSTGTAMQSGQLKTLVARRSTLWPTQAYEYVRDVMMLPAYGPLVGGTQVSCWDFSGIGYGVVSASPREFFGN